MSANEQVGIHLPDAEYIEAMASFTNIRDGLAPAKGLVDARIRLERAREALGLTKHRLTDMVEVPAVRPDSVVGADWPGGQIPERPKLNNEYCAVLMDLADKTSAAIKLCGSDFTNVRTPEQVAAYDAKTVAEIRARAYQDAVDNGNFGTYLEMRQMDARMMRDPAADLAVNQRGLLKPASLDQVQAVALLNQRLANASYSKHLAAVAESKDGSSERADAIEHLKAAAAAARLADGTMQSLMAAQSEYRDATVAMARGDEPAATASAMVAAQHLVVVADQIDRFGSDAPKARLFPVALTTVIKNDVAVGRIEAKVERKVEDFVRGIKGFAQRVHTLADSIKTAPAMVTKVAASACISVARSAAAFFDRVTGGADAMLQRAVAKSSAAAVSVEQKAWNALDASADLLARAGASAGSVVDSALKGVGTVDLHVRATAGLAGGLLSRAARAVADSYSGSVDAVREKRLESGMHAEPTRSARSPRPR